MKIVSRETVDSMKMMWLRRRSLYNWVLLVDLVVKP